MPRDPVKWKAWQLNYRKKNKDKLIALADAWNKLHPEKAIDRSRAQRRLVFIAYGNKCVCCQEAIFEFLSLDHVGGRKRGHPIDKLKGDRLVRWLLKNNCLQDIHVRILCHNCNQAIGYYGICPHQMKGELPSSL